MSSVFNRRNAVIGWLTVVFGRKLVALKLKKPPEPEPKSGKAKKGVIAVVVAGALGAAAFLRLRSRDGGSDAPPADAPPTDA